MSDPTFQQYWELLRAELEERNRQLQAQYLACLEGMAAGFRSQVDRVRQEALPPQLAGGNKTFQSLVLESGERLLFEPVRAVRKARFQQKALEALEAHESAMDHLVRRGPQTVAVPGGQFVDTVGVPPGASVRAWYLRRRSQIDLPLRSILERHFLEESQRRAMLDGTCFLVLARASLLLLSPWQDLRRLSLLHLTGQSVERQAWERSRQRWLDQASAIRAEVDRLPAAFDAWATGSLNRLTSAILSPRRVNSKKASRLQARRQSNFRFWSRQQRAVTALLDLEWELTRTLLESASAGETTLDEISAEHTALGAELDAVVAWLQEARDTPIGDDFPPPEAELVSADSRVSAWERRLDSAACSLLPLEVETVDPRHALPARREPWRHLEPQREFQSALARLGRPVVRDGFREVEDDHRVTVRVIERAREVVEFSLETAAADPVDGPAIAREGFVNAVALLSHARQTMADPRDKAEKKLVHGVASTFHFLHLNLEQRRLGLVTHLVRQSGSRAAQESSKVVLQKTAAALGWLNHGVRNRYHWSLRKAGWEVAPVAAQAPVTSRGYVGEMLNLQVGARDLPMIYRRLFRLAPVEEPRFLVGRELEMAALARARSLWNFNRSVAVVLVGDRGSGKTSLLNCAAAREFSDVDIIRGQFSERIRDSDQMRSFLRALFQIPEDADIVEDLSTRKRVVFLEELERTFLRRVNGFDALKDLLSIVSASCHSTLWVLGVNQHSYQFLDAAIGLGQYFSHRINAMAIPQQQLKNAILLRHNLSGLRLQFPAIPETKGNLQPLQQLLGLLPNAEDRFFDALYHQSDGIFRSAFELWQHFMERVEGGVLYLRQPAEPDYEPIIAEFRQADLFTLKAILQHGSLTAEDHAEVFECPLQRSRVQMQRLLNLECLGRDPTGPGWRIRPEAGRLVRMALHRQNLI